MIYEAYYKGEVARYTEDEFRKVPGFRPGTVISLIGKITTIQEANGTKIVHETGYEISKGIQRGKRGLVVTYPGFLTDVKRRLIKRALFMEADNE